MSCISFLTFLFEMHYLHFYWDFLVKIGEALSIWFIWHYQCSCSCEFKLPSGVTAFGEKIKVYVPKTNSLSFFSLSYLKIFILAKIYILWPSWVFVYWVMSLFCLIFFKDSFAILDSWLTVFFLCIWIMLSHCFLPSTVADEK